MRIPIPEKFVPLYTTKKPIILITGGRGGSKSFQTSLFIKRLTYERGHVILFTRYTMTSAEKSIIPEYQEKIKMEGDVMYFDVAAREIINKVSGSKILFDGIKTSSGNQTAKLKGTQGMTTFIMDEGEEWQSEKDFNTIRLGTRTKSARNRTLIIMNPCSDLHFIYKKYLRDSHRIEMIDGVPVQISTHPKVCHIHSTYLDNLDYLSEEFLEDIAEIKSTNPKEYAEIVIGRWGDGTSQDMLFDSQCIADMFSNNIAPSTEMYLVTDAARYGRDFNVTMVFRGWEILAISILKTSDVHDIVADIECLRKHFKIQKSRCLVDADGVGGSAVKMGDYRAFRGGAQPRKITGIRENFKNLKTQCAFGLAEHHVNNGNIRINANAETISVDGVRGSKIKVGSRLTDVMNLIIEDMRCVRYANVDNEGKKTINSKDEQKELLGGRSPDFFDCLNMRYYFELIPKSEYL